MPHASRLKPLISRLTPILDYFVYLIVRVFICLVQSMRYETCRAIAQGLAYFAAEVVGVRRKLVDENLRHAFPEMSALERRELTLKMWEHLFKLAIEAAHSPRKIHDVNWRKVVELDNVEQVHRMLCEDRPLIFVTGHFGNFEIGGYLLGLLGYPTYTIARKLDNPYLNDFVEEFREITGQHILSKNDGAEPVMEVLERNETLTLLADQHAGRRGYWIDFFGRPASAYKAIAVMSLKYNAPVAVCYATRLSDRPMHFRMKIAGIYDPKKPIPGIESVKDITQWYSSLLEEGIREQPDQYWWIHNRWKSRDKSQ